MDVKIDVSGDMEPQKPEPTSQFNFNWANISTTIPTASELFRQLKENIRSWAEFFHMQNFKTVANLQRLSSRLMRNLAYFQSNYLCIFLILMIYCLITSPLILIVLAVVFYACYKIRQAQTALTLFGKRINTYQQCLIVNFASMPLLYLAGAGAALFWVLGASFFVITLHAIFYNIDAIVTEDTEGFLAETV